MTDKQATIDIANRCADNEGFFNKINVYLKKANIDDLITFAEDFDCSLKLAKLLSEKAKENKLNIYLQNFIYF